MLRLKKKKLKRMSNIYVVYIYSHFYLFIFGPGQIPTTYRLGCENMTVRPIWIECVKGD